MVKFKLWEKLGGPWMMDPTGMESLGGGVRFWALRRGVRFRALRGGGVSQPNPTCPPMYGYAVIHCNGIAPFCAFEYTLCKILNELLLSIDKKTW